ncbi:MAG: mechanosensitive ion channel family protein [Bacteroidia bacterium]|nr:mechanosensitive ion channel family protein [Bacteroidia bacterium]MDW8346674.1 mechanosensitive ion channel [Bacteroidia bacterium]
MLLDIQVPFNDFLTKNEQFKIVASIVVIGVLWLFRRLLYRLVVANIKEKKTKYQTGKTINYVISFLGVLIVARIWFDGFQSIATFLGLLSAGLAIALKDPVSNLAGWVYIIWRKPFDLGHRIQIGTFAGDVIDISMFQFSIMEIGNWVDADQHTGRVIHVPNGKIFTEPLANYSQGVQYIWHEVPVHITYESNWEKARDILKNIVIKHTAHHTKEAEKQAAESSKEYLLIALTLNPNVYVSVEEYSIRLTMRYLCNPRKRRSTEQTMWEEVLKAFAQCPDISLAYPTTRFYNNLQEGKPQLGYRQQHLFHRATKDGFENL